MKGKHMQKSDFYENLTNNLITELEKGVVPWEQPWFSRNSKPFNPVSGKHYQGVNFLNLSLIASTLKLDLTDPRFMTFNQAKQKGWQVKKGSKSVANVVYFSILEKEEIEANDQGNDEAVLNKFALLKYSPVFHASQIEGIPELNLPTTKTFEFEPNLLAQSIIDSSKAVITTDSAGAYYSPTNDVIAIPPINSFKSQAGYYGTLLHELGHWTGHASRLNRSFGYSANLEEYAREELVAELASVFLCAETGIEFQAGNHSAYIGSWLKALKGDKLEIKRASSQAMQVVNYLLNFIEKKEIEN